MGYTSGIQLFVFLARNLDVISCNRMIKRLMDIRMRIGCAACAVCWGMGTAAQPLLPAGGWGLGRCGGSGPASLRPDALAARHTFRSAYWDYRSFRADYLPSLTLTSARTSTVPSTKSRWKTVGAFRRAKPVEHRPVPARAAECHLDGRHVVLGILPLAYGFAERPHFFLEERAGQHRLQPVAFRTTA